MPMRDASRHAGVEGATDDATGNAEVERPGRHAERTFRPEVIAGPGTSGVSFGTDTPFGFARRRP